MVDHDRFYRRKRAFPSKRTEQGQAEFLYVQSWINFQYKVAKTILRGTPYRKRKMLAASRDE